MQRPPTEPISINMVLSLLERKASKKLGSALLAAFEEVEAFYNLGMNRAVFRRFDISEGVETRDRSIASRLWDLLSEPLGRKRQEKQETLGEGVFLEKPTPEQWQGAKGAFSGTVDAGKIAKLVGELLAEQGAGKRVIVIDRELTPPPGWRYIIWHKGYRVISTVPLDPQYWGMEDPDRTAIIKHRVRTVCLRIVGKLLGLGICANESCFLYRNVDSVMRLDGMVKLGTEHTGHEALKGQGFEILTSDPATVQPIILDPGQKRRFYER